MCVISRIGSSYISHQLSIKIDDRLRHTFSNIAKSPPANCIVDATTKHQTSASKVNTPPTDQDSTCNERTNPLTPYPCTHTGTHMHIRIQYIHDTNVLNAKALRPQTLFVCFYQISAFALALQYHALVTRFPRLGARATDLLP
jgi:hypothetical protein